MRFLVLLLLGVALTAEAKDDVEIRLTPAFVHERSTHTLTMFRKLTGHPHGYPGCQIDHIRPLKRGGLDVWWNCQWLPVEAKALKDRWE